MKNDPNWLIDSGTFLDYATHRWETSRGLSCRNRQAPSTSILCVSRHFPLPYHHHEASNVRMFRFRFGKYITFFGYDYYWQSTRHLLEECRECVPKSVIMVHTHTLKHNHADKVKHGNFDKWSFGAFRNTNNSCSCKEYMESDDWTKRDTCFWGCCLFVCRAVGYVCMCVNPILTVRQTFRGVNEWRAEEYRGTYTANHPSE